MIPLITTKEFNDRLEKGDVVCKVAAALADSSFVPINLRLSNKYIIHSYINKAEELISKLDKHNLEIVNILI